MTDTPEQRLPAPRPDAQPAPVPRFTAPPSAHAFELTPERAAGIVRQSASARWWGFLAVLVVVLFVIGYYFYELGVPGVAELAPGCSTRSTPRRSRASSAATTSTRPTAPAATASTGRASPTRPARRRSTSRTSCSRISTRRTSQSVLREGGRYVCGNAKSLMPVWSNDNGGPLNYQQIDDLIAFLRATNDHTYIVRDPDTDEPVKDATGKTEDVHRLGRPELQAGAGRDALPGLLDERLREQRWQPERRPHRSRPGTTVVDVKAQNIAFTTTEHHRPGRQDVPDQVRQRGRQRPAQRRDQGLRPGKSVFKGDLVTGVTTTTYTVPALPAGTYPFNCTVHPNMTGTLTVK